jgi:subtilisin-like proprotein convertase family protein
MLPFPRKRLVFALVIFCCAVLALAKFGTIGQAASWSAILAPSIATDPQDSIISVVDGGRIAEPKDFARITLGNNVSVSLPTIPQAFPGPLAIPVTVGDLTAGAVTSYEFNVDYDPTLVRPAKGIPTTAGTLSSDMAITADNYGCFDGAGGVCSNGQGMGHFTVSGFQATPLTGSGTLIILNFVVQPVVLGYTALVFADHKDITGLLHPAFAFNEGDPVPNPITNGSVCVCKFTPTNTATSTPTRTATPAATLTATPPVCPANNISNTAAITINDNRPASPYPSNITLSGLSGTVRKVTVDLFALNHAFPDDVDIMLVSPSGRNTLLMSDAGSSFAVGGLTLTFDDGAADPLPDTAHLTSGLYRPTNYDTSTDVFPAAPVPGANVSLSVFNGTNPNGTWSLYVRDDLGNNVGSIVSGWYLHVFTNSCFTPTPTSTAGTPIGTPAPIPVSLPALTVPPGSFDYSVPITAGHISGSNPTINSYELQISFNSAVVQPASPPFDQAGTLSSKMTITAEAANVGHLKISAFSVGPPLEGAGTLLNLKFNVVGNPGLATALAFEDYTGPGGVHVPGFWWNEGDPPATTTNGSIFVFGNTPTRTPTFTPTATFTPTRTPTNASTPLVTPSELGGTRTLTATATATVTQTFTPTMTATCTPRPFSNTGIIPMNDGMMSSSAIGVSTMVGTVTRVTVDLKGISHSYPDDVDIMLVGPGGQNTILMSDAGGDGDISNVNLTFDDAAETLPDEARLVSGTFKPTNHDTDSDVFPAPAPLPGALASMSVFNGTNANGAWTLYVRDDTNLDFGSINGGWTLHIMTTGGGGCGSPTPTPTATASQPTPVTSFSQPTYSEDESQAASITVSRSTAFFVSGVRVSTSNGTATGGAACTSGVDYINVSQFLTFFVGETTKTVYIPLCGDNFIEPDQSVNLSLTEGNIGSPSTAVLTIKDTASAFRNTENISITGGGSAMPYPSTITVTGGPTTIGSMRVTLYDLSSRFPDNADFLLVGPNGSKFILLAGAGGIAQGGPATLNFTDTAGAVVPDNGPLTTGNFEPTSWTTVGDFPAPAPSGPYNLPGSTIGGTGTQTLMGNFGGTNANGAWNLYVRDRSPASDRVGNLAGGWGLEFVGPTAAGASISGRVATADGRGLRNATVAVTGNSLSSPIVATTGSFGYFAFEGLATGETYVVTVNSRRYSFSAPSRVISLVENVVDADFVADPIE